MNERVFTMSDILANDVRKQYNRAFDTIKGILDVFPESKWLEQHGDEYYIPSRITYHLAEFIDGAVAGGFKDPDFKEKLPFGDWHQSTAETLPGKSELITYYNEVIERAKKMLDAIDDESVTALLPPEMARMGASQIGAHMGVMRELSAHTGELNKMLIENGLDDIWK